MSFPNRIYGDYGDEKVAQSTKIGGLPLGTAMELPDGRLFRQAKMSATAGVAGKVYIETAVVAGHGNVSGSGLICPTAVSVGDESIVLTVGGTGAVTLNQYAEGTLNMISGTGSGISYKIKSHAAAGTTVAVTINLEDNDSIAATIAAGTTTAGLRKNLYDEITIRPTGSAQVGPVIGVLPVAASASFYCWLQKTGPASCRVSATAIVIGQPVVASTGEAGMITAQVASTTAVIEEQMPIGITMNVSAASEHSLVDLSIE